MSNFKSLLKYTLINTIGINKLNKKKNKTPIGLEITLAVIYLLILAFVTFYMFIFANLFSQAGEPKFIFIFIITLSSFICFFTTLSKANVYIFRTKDYDSLMSLPIKTSTIVASKLISLYIYNFIFVFTMFVATEIAYFIINGFNIVLFLLMFIVMVLLPLFPMVISSLIAFLLGFIPLRQKTKNILSTVLYLLFLIVFLYFYMQIFSISDSEVPSLITDLYAKTGKVYFLADFAYAGACNGDILKLLLFIIISIIPAILFIALIAKCFKKFNNMLNRNKNNTNYKLSKEKFTSSKGEIQTIFGKELKMYFGFPSYLINTACGPILSVLTVVIFALNYSTFSEGMKVFVGEEAPFAIDNNFFLMLVSLIIVFCISLVSTTAASISLEGKSFWILKSAPVKTSSVFWGKSLLNMVINIPFIIIDIIVAGIILKVNPLFIIGCLIIPVSYSMSATFFGLYFNIIKPNFNFDNPIKTIKQDIPVLLNVLLSFLITIIVFIGMFVGLTTLGQTITLILEIVVSLIFFGVSALLLFTKGVKKYEKIQF